MQLTLFDDFFGTVEHAEQIEQTDLAEIVLKRGSGIQDGKKRIHEFALTNPTIGAFATFLKDEYGVGGYSTPRRAPNTIHSEDHDSTGIIFKGLDSHGEEEQGKLAWKKAAEIITRLVREDRYL